MRVCRFWQRVLASGRVRVVQPHFGPSRIPASSFPTCALSMEGEEDAESQAALEGIPARTLRRASTLTAMSEAWHVGALWRADMAGEGGDRALPSYGAVSRQRVARAAAMQRQEEAAALQPTHLVPLLLHVEHCISCDKHAFCTRHPVFATRCDIEGDVDGPASELTYTVRRRAHSVAEAMDGVERRPPNASPACVVVETEYSRAADRLEETVWKTFPEGGVTFNTVAAAGGDAKDGTTTAVPVVDARLLPPSDPVTGKVVDRWVPLDRDSDASREQGARTWHWLRGAHAPRAPRLSAFEVTAHWPGWGPPVALHSKLASGSFPSLSPRPGSGMSLFAARALLAVARVHAQQLARMCDRTRPVGAPSAALFQALARGREEDAHRGAASPLAQWGRRRFEEETSRSVPALGPSSASRSPASAVGQGARRGAAGPAVAREGAGQMWSPRAEDDGRGGDLRHTPPDSPIPAVEASAAEAEAPGKAAPLDPWQRVPFFVAVGALDRAVALWGAQAPPEETARWHAHLWDSLCYEPRLQRALTQQRAAAATVSWIDVLLLLLKGEASPLARGECGVGPCPLETAARTLQESRQARAQRWRGRTAPPGGRSSAGPWLRIPRTRAGEAAAAPLDRPAVARSPGLPGAAPRVVAAGEKEPRAGRGRLPSPRGEQGPAEPAPLPRPSGGVEGAVPRPPPSRVGKGRSAGETEVRLHSARKVRVVPAEEAGALEAAGRSSDSVAGGGDDPVCDAVGRRERKPLPAPGSRSAARVGDRLTLGSGGRVGSASVRSGTSGPQE